MSSYEQLDLDINNYTIPDLEQFFRLSPAASYTTNDIQYKETVVREQLLQSGNIHRKFKADLIRFLENAKNRLIDAKCPPLPAPTSIPANFRLDPTPDIPVPTVSIPRTHELVPTAPSYAPAHTTNGNQFYAGQLNPLETRLKTTNICIDTLFRKNYGTTKSTDFTYILPKVINNVVSLKLSSFEFPFVWYAVSASQHNNSFSIAVFNMVDTPDASYNIVVPDGNYSPVTFATTINNIFNLIGGGLNYMYCEIDSVTLGTVFRARNETTDKAGGGAFPFSTGGANYSPDFRFRVDFSVNPAELSYCKPGTSTSRPPYKNLGWLLGFRQTSYDVLPTNESISFVSDPYIPIYYQCFLKGESFFGSTMTNYVLVEIDDFHNNFPTDSIICSNDQFGGYVGKNIIARVVVRSGINSMINDNAADLIFKKRDYFGPVNLEKMKIRVLNRFGDVIDLNQNDYSMTIEVTTLQTNM
jgi:hypothetical protein